MFKASVTRERKSRRARHDFLQASSWCLTGAPRETVICSRPRCTTKVSNENALTFFCGLILHLLSADLELIELVSTATVTINIIGYY